jgi:two-component system sensor histidine kinase KdpD
MPKLTGVRRELRSTALALVLVAALTAVMLWLTQYVQPTNRSSIYLIPVVAAAARWGVIPAVTAALAGILAAVFFFYEPVYSFKVPHTPQLVNLALFIVIALVVGRLAVVSRSQAELARRRENEVRDLYAFSRRLSVARGAQDIYAAIQEHLSSLLQRRSVLFEADSETPGDPIRTGDRFVPAAVHAEVTKYLDGEATADTGTVVKDQRGSNWLVRHVAPSTPAFGVIAVDLGTADGDLGDIRGRVDEVLADAAATLDRMDVARVIAEAHMRAEAEVLREALIGSVSHELRTPLASILGSATVLCNTPPVLGDERLAALANVIRDEAERLNSDIQNLLDATRITSQSVKPLRQWYDLADLVNSALKRRDWRLADHVVVMDVANDLPLIYVDPVLMEQALVQIIDNAAKYSPTGSTITVTGRRSGSEIVLAVTDQGTGFTPEERRHLGERFFRGPRHLTTTPGTGLGLWIANAFVTACDGELAVVSGGANLGSTVSIHLPIADEAILQLERTADD